MIGTLIFNTLVIGFFSLVGLTNDYRINIERFIISLSIITIFNIIMLAFEAGKASK